MFFDDAVVRRVKSCYPKSIEAAHKLVASIIDSFIKKLKTDLEKDINNDRRYCRTCTKKVINLWDSAARKLEQDGYPLLAEGGLKEILRHQLPEEFKHFVE